MDFDAMTMASYLATPMSLTNVTAQDPMAAGPLLPLDMPDHQSNFDAETYVGSEDATVYGQQSLAHGPPTLRRFPSTYEDPFSDALSAYQDASQIDPNGTDAPSIDRDNKLLSFSVPSFHYALLDYTYRRTTITLSAQLHGMFFLAESPWASVPDAGNPPAELTCYRRNLFQITGNITIPRTLRYILTETGEQVPILGQELTISATESVEGNSVKIISVPWKTPAAGAPPVEDKTEKEPAPIPLDLMYGQDMESELTTFPIAWKRLQFRIATANNGRRKELQQHFVVRLKLIATLATGVKIPICEVQSQAIIVRGRSPRNFQSRKDFPLNGASSARKMHLPAQPTRQSTGDSSTAQQNNQLPTPDRVKPPPVSVPTTAANNVHDMGFTFDDPAMVSPDFFNWKIPNNGTGAMTALPMDTLPQGNNGMYAQSSPDMTRYPPHNNHSHKPSLSTAPSAPINLSLTDDEPSPLQSGAMPTSNPRRTTSQSPANIESAFKTPRLTSVPARPPSFSLGMISSPDESADLLYEYFPLGLDDWMPPVDAVYRPHVVHHVAKLGGTGGEGPAGGKERGKSKRYFSEDVG